MATAAKGTEESAEQGRPEPAEQIAAAILIPVDVARRVLPENGLPIYLGIGALALVDLIDWPVAVAAGLGYYVLKRWKPTESAAGH
ncbi:hypothetical protein [Saccharopolyspora pogona]|uniref:hypothetical protein n=1 Tax=Saccharopolyspora pogona TaxID=333966 RepID=UPI0016894901|nr:hypothetical protein [Saccharopolyspora pogona]